MSINKYSLPRRSVSRNNFAARDNPTRSPSPNTSLQIVPKDNPIGLASIGRGRPLNSIIQFLYAAEDFRECLIAKLEAGMEVSNSTLGMLLGMIFKSLKDKDQRYQTIQKQTEIVTIITQNLAQVNKNQQRRFEEDSLETLMNILNEIQNHHPQLTGLFDVEYSSKCECCQFSTQDRVISYSEAKCMTCGEFNQINLIKAPRYIIYFNQLNTKIEGIKIQEGQGMNGPYNYKQKARIIYTGKGQQGHYAVQRENDNKLYHFRDQVVNRAERRSVKEINSNEIILLYELQQTEKDKRFAIPANRKNSLNSFKNRLNTYPSPIISKQQNPLQQIKQKEDKKKGLQKTMKKGQIPAQIIVVKEKAFEKIPLKWVTKVKFVQMYQLNHPSQRFIMMKGPQGIVLRTLKRDNTTSKEYTDFNQEYNKMKASTNQDVYAKILAKYLADKLIPSRSRWFEDSDYRFQKEKLPELQQLEFRHVFRSDQDGMFTIVVLI